ncbi:MAG: YlxR family protein [Trueperaceae bacterium]
MTPRTRHVPMRRCVRCRTTAPKAELVRFVRDAEGTWRLDPSGKTAGRGAWLCPACAARANERDLKRAFRTSATTVVADLDAHLTERRPAREG